jgi:hypothetical protein
MPRPGDQHGLSFRSAGWRQGWHTRWRSRSGFCRKQLRLSMRQAGSNDSDLPCRSKEWRHGSRCGAPDLVIDRELGQVHCHQQHFGVLAAEPGDHVEISSPLHLHAASVLGPDQGRDLARSGDADGAIAGFPVPHQSITNVERACQRPLPSAAEQIDAESAEITDSQPWNVLSSHRWSTL